jgi:hypothetical protein
MRKEYRVTVSNSETRWYKLGTNQLHREDGPAIEHSDGTKHWYLNGKRHREDGPAIEFPDGTKEWYLNGKYHREDGPAIEFSDGTKIWYLNGKRLTEQDFLARTNSCNGKVVEIDGKKYQLKEVSTTKK